MIYFVLIIIGLLILGVILSYIIVISVTMLGFIVGKIIKNFKSNHTFNPFDKKVYTSQTCGYDGWYAQYCEHLINHRKDFWWVPIWYFNKIGQRFCMAKKQSYNQGYDGVKKCPSDFIPKVLNNGISQPTPKSHADNLTRDATKCKQNPFYDILMSYQYTKQHQLN